MAEWKNGQVILGEYAIEKELGRGGMGCVWLVKSNSTGRRFAVKQTLLNEAEHRKAFLAELQTWIDLPEHPNIVPCRFFRTVGDDVLIFSEFVDGGSLKNWIDSRRLYEGDQRQSLKRILDTAIQFAWGLHSIHELGLVHQDVKPGNVLMSGGAEAALQGMRVQVSDYGLARARARSGAQGVQAAGEGSILLSSGGYTPAYCSPEQAKGLPITRKTDQWSWGVSLLEMFTGGVTWHSGHMAGAVLDQYVEDADESSGIPVMPSALADILRKCFQNDPAERWANLAEVVAHLKTAYSTITGEDYDRELVRILDRDKLQTGSTKPQTVHDNYVDPLYWLTRSLRLSGRSPEEARAIVGNRGRTRRGQLVSDIALFEEARNIFEDLINKTRRQELEPELAYLCMGKGEVHRSANDVGGAITEYDKSVAIWRQLVNQKFRRDQVAGLAWSLQAKGDVLQMSGRFSEALGVYNEIIEVWRAQISSDDSLDKSAAPLPAHDDTFGDVVAIAGRRNAIAELAGALMGKANILGSMGELDAALQLHKECTSIWRRLVEGEGRTELSPHLAGALMNEATTLARLGHLEDSLVLNDECITIRRQLVAHDGRSQPIASLAWALMNRGQNLGAMRCFAEAADAYSESVALFRRLVEEEGRDEVSADLAEALMNQGASVTALGDLELAVALYDKCIDLRQRLVDQMGRHEMVCDLADALRAKGEALHAHGLAADANSAFVRSLALFQSLVDHKGLLEHTEEYARTLLGQGRTLYDMGDFEGALQHHEMCSDLLRTLVKQGNRIDLCEQLAGVLMNKCFTMHDMRKFKEAIPSFDESVAMHRFLIDNMGRKDLLANWARVELGRSSCVIEQGVLSAAEEQRIVRAANVLYEEAEKSGRADLQSVLQWAITRFNLARH